MDRAGRWRGWPYRATVAVMEWNWRVGVLRSLAENVAWTSSGSSPDWSTARVTVEATVTELAAAEGRQEYRFEFGDVRGMVMPGLHEDGRIDLRELCSSLPEQME